MELMRRPHRTGKSKHHKRPGPRAAHAPRHQAPPRKHEHAPPRKHAHPPREQEPPRNHGPRERVAVQGVLELHPKGYGFLRDPARSYLPQPSDAYVPGPLLTQLHLREGLLLAGPAEVAYKDGGPRLISVDTIEGQPVETYRPRNFDDLTPIVPHQMIVLETGAEPLTTRVMDMLTPIGKGQRGLIVAPPRTGKTILLQHIAQAVTKNHPEMHVMMLLIDERPEEVTEMRRTIEGEVIASSSDRDATAHARLA